MRQPSTRGKFDSKGYTDTVEAQEVEMREEDKAHQEFLLGNDELQTGNGSTR